MNKYVPCLTLALVLIPSTIHAQISDKHPAAVGTLISNAALGIAFRTNATVTQVGSSRYVASLNSGSGRIRAASASIVTAPHPFVDLPGSYGGPMALDEPIPAALAACRVSVDTVATGTIRFRREVWAVYAGMGAWEATVVCTAQLGGRCFVLALHTVAMLGHPGEQQERETLNAEHLRSELAERVTDPGEPVVQEFANIVASFAATGSAAQQ